MERKENRDRQELDRERNQEGSNRDLDGEYYGRNYDRHPYNYTSGGRAREWDRAGDDWGGWRRGRR